MESIIHIALQQEALPMIMDVKKNIEEGDLNPTFMDLDHLMLMKINVKMATTEMQRLGYLGSNFLVSMALVILMYI